MNRAFVRSLALVVPFIAACATHAPVPPPEALSPPPGVNADCWVDVYSGNKFGGKAKRIWGPVRLATLKFGDRNWNDEIDSIAVGPGAFVSCFRDENFGGTVIHLISNETVADLGDLHMDGDIESMVVSDQAGP